MPAYVVERTKQALEHRGVALKGAKVLVLGVAYKRDVDDLRESPALRIIELLAGSGAEVEYHDPFFPEVGHGRHYALNRRAYPLTEGMTELGGFDCVLIATDHSAYDFERVVEQARLVVDTRNAARGIASGKIVRC